MIDLDKVKSVRWWPIVVTFWLLWAVTLVTAYYQQLWALFSLGPSAWVTENYSLTAVRELWHLVRAGSTAWSLPAYEEAAARALAGIFGAILVLLAAQVLGVAICRLLRWRPEDWRDGLLYRTGLGLGAISYLSLGMAALGIYDAANVRLMIGIVLLGGGLWLGYTWTRSGKQWVERLPKVALLGQHYPGDRLWQAITLLAVLIALVGALAPEIEYDAVWYHLWLPKLWLEQGRPVDLVAEFITLYPLTWELVFSAGMVWGGPVAAKLLHFICLPLTGLLIYQLVRRFVPHGSAWLAIALFITAPTILWEATTTYVDLALTLYIGLTIYALLHYLEGRKWQWLALAALSLGLALAVKHLGLFVLAITTTGLALCLWLEDRNLRRALLPAVILGLVSLLLPLPWYLRNWFASGNPVFPDLYDLFGAFPPERWNEYSERSWRNFSAKFGRPNTFFSQLTLVWDMTVHGTWYDGTFGPLFLLLAPALVLLRRTSRVIPWLIAFVLVYIGLWASPLNGLELRFLIPLVPLLAVLAAEASSRLTLLLQSRLGKWSVHLFQASLVVLLLLNLPPFTSLHEGDRVRWNGWLTHVIHRVPLGVVIGYESQEDYLSRSIRSYAAWRYINTHLPDSAYVLTFSSGDHLYSQRKRLWSDSTMAQPMVWRAQPGQEQQAFQTLLDMDISHILFDKQQLDLPQFKALVITQLPTHWYQVDYEDDNFVLYRLDRQQMALALNDALMTKALVTQEIRYYRPTAGQVFLVWGVNGWAVVAEELHPAGTVIKDEVMHTPMVREGDTFVAKVQVPAGTGIDYGFLITQEATGTPVRIWEANEDQDYYSFITKDGVIEILSKS